MRPICEKSLLYLREYYLKYQPVEWLFPSGQNPKEHFSTSPVQKEFKKAVVKSGISKEIIEQVRCPIKEENLSLIRKSLNVEINAFTELISGLPDNFSFALSLF